MLLMTIALLLGCLIAMRVKPARQGDLNAAKPITYRINPNEADVHALSLLPGIAHGKAQRMIDERQANGPFQDVDDLTRVPLIGEKIAAGIRPWVRFDTPPGRAVADAR